MTFVLLAIALILVALTFIGRFEVWPRNEDPKITTELVGKKATGTLFVLIHGMDNGRHWPDMESALAEYGDLLKISYPVFSNADPLNVSINISQSIESTFQPDHYHQIVLIGESLGALIARRAFLIGEAEDAVWSKRLTRITLLAGLNRGWDISGQKPSDMQTSTWLKIWLGSWLGRLAGIGGFARSAESGSPFVANLRLDWMHRMRDENQRSIEVVQLLGDIDDVVSQEDNKDLYFVSSSKFSWVKVRGTGHKNIADFTDKQIFSNTILGKYRQQKFLLATTGEFAEVNRENEELPFPPDTSITNVVFVLHGIRDLGEWAAAFEHELHLKFKQQFNVGKLAVASTRYGYFGMGPFILKPIREKYVKWFMDEYTETIARYPNAESIHFVGHSNGTYLLASALERYSSLKIDRVVFGGSVVRQNYDWDKRFDTKQVTAVRNYQATNDWVVALFPRFFEPTVMEGLFSNDIGSAGFNGFESNHSMLDNIAYIEGGHSAFLNRIPEIADFLLGGDEHAVTPKGDVNSRNLLLKWCSQWANWLMVWPLLASLIFYIGWHVVTSASEPRWPFLVGYISLLLIILHKI